MSHETPFMRKRCLRCSEMKFIEDFTRSSSKNGAVRSYCRSCVTQISTEWAKANKARRNEIVRKSLAKTGNVYHKRYHERLKATRPYVDMLRRAKSRARKHGLEYDLDTHKPDIVERMAPNLCELSGIPFDLTPGLSFYSPSIDRIDNAGGYTYSNVRLILHGLNAAIGPWGEEVLIAAIEAVIERRANREAT